MEAGPFPYAQGGSTHVNQHSTRVKRAGPRIDIRGPALNAADAQGVLEAGQLSSSSIRNPRIGEGAWPIGDGPCGRTGAIGWVMAGDICCWPP